MITGKGSKIKPYSIPATVEREAKLLFQIPQTVCRKGSVGLNVTVMKVCLEFEERGQLLDDLFLIYGICEWIWWVSYLPPSTVNWPCSSVKLCRLAARSVLSS